jgi:isochorismate synthase
VVAVGENSSIRIEKGLFSLDPHQEQHYNLSLVERLSHEHFLTAAIPFNPSIAFDVVIPLAAVVFPAEGPIHISFPQGKERAASTLLHEIIRGRLVEPQLSSGTLDVKETESSIEFRSRVVDAIEAIKTSSLEKVVLSKTACLSGADLPGADQILEQLARDRPDTYLFSTEKYVGASPELVVSRQNAMIASHPLAGTAHAQDQALLLNSVKDKEEHQIVVKQIINRLEELGIDASYQAQPTLVRYNELVHLSSWISGAQGSPQPFTSIEVAAHLAPTAAINGEPFDDAINYILCSEPLDRGLYGGLVGFQKQNGDGSWILNIRSVQIASGNLVLRAGAGVVEKSDPIKEDMEASAKISSVAYSITGHQF